jgi:hypothetical protein
MSSRRRSPRNAAKKKSTQSSESVPPEKQDTRFARGEFRTLRAAGDIDRDIYPHPNYRLNCNNPDLIIILVLFAMAAVILARELAIV